jgi:hypothetical protein
MLMNKLKTPLGSIKIYNDDTEIEYNAVKLDNDPAIFPNVDGRYRIAVEYESDNLTHLICCVIDNMDCSKVKCHPETGERLECQAFYQGRVKLSIGIECDTGYFNTGERISNYDYDSRYLENGIGYSILPITETNELVFGIAWINECTDENDVQTWYGADPTLM